MANSPSLATKRNPKAILVLPMPDVGQGLPSKIKHAVTYSNSYSRLDYLQHALLVDGLGNDCLMLRIPYPLLFSILISSLTNVRYVSPASWCR